MGKDLDEIWMKLFNREELDEEERVFFSKWEAHSRDNRIVSSILKRLLVDVKRKKYKGWQEAYAHVIARVKRERRRRVLLYTSVAASVLLVVLGVLFAFPGKDDQAAVAIVEHQCARVSGVELISPDGQTYYLGNDSSRIVIADSTSEMRVHDKVLFVSAREDNREQAEYYTIKVPLGGEYTVLLPDSTRIYLNAGTTLRYPNKFIGKNREVFLSGEAYFDVYHDESRPFIVRAEQISIQVLGTSFNVNAYPAWKEVKTTLVEGKISVKSGRDTIIMVPGTQVVYNKETRECVYTRVDVNNFISWKDGYYDFENLSLEELMFIFSNWYNLEIVYMNEQVKALKFGGRLQRYDDVSSLLRQLEYTQDVHFKLDGNKLIVR